MQNLKGKCEIAAGRAMFGGFIRRVGDSKEIAETSHGRRGASKEIDKRSLQAITEVGESPNVSSSLMREGFNVKEPRWKHTIAD